MPPKRLHVIAYHYVRDLERTPFPRLKAMTTADFDDQLAWLTNQFEFATLESALAFLAGDYRPSRDLCLLTFDDGVRDHFDTVFPRLAARGIQGVFFLVSSCLQGGVAAVHKTHFLMASLGFEEYRRRFLGRLAAEQAVAVEVDFARARSMYRWDTDEVVRFKYLLNFALPDSVRTVVLDDLFSQCFGDEAEFSRALYLNWQEALMLQRNGMIIGGHTHKHAALSRLAPTDQRRDLEISTVLLRQNLDRQAVWPFSYPYGKADAFDSSTISTLRQLGYACGFTTEPDGNTTGQDVFTIHRIDPKEVRAAVGVLPD